MAESAFYTRTRVQSTPVRGAWSMLMAAYAIADEWPLVQGNYWDVTGAKLKYLVTVSEDLPSAATSEKRQDEYMAWRKKTLAQMEKESGNRAEFREVISSSLLQELTFRK